MKNNPTNTRLFSVKYLGPTDYRGSRVKIIDERNRKSKTISYRHEYNNIWEMAVAYLSEIEINIVSMGETENTFILASDNFTTSLR